MVNIAIIGDIHEQFNTADADYFNRSDYDLLLLVGDVVGVFNRRAYPAARAIGQLRKPALFIPGNHDGNTPLQLLAGLKQLTRLAVLFSRGQEKRVAALCRRLGNALCCGYSEHAYYIRGLAFDVIAARPFSMGGPVLSYRPYLQRTYGVGNMAQSAARLCALVDAAASDRLIFLAHNGPTGLGDRRAAIWGRDFAPDGGDHGDPDLRTAIDYTKKGGKTVAAVVAGHMHHRLKGGGARTWRTEADGVCYVNAARVPRIFTRAGQTVHHHLRLTLTETAVDVDEVLAPLPA